MVNRCDECGKFISSKDNEAKTWTRWAGSAEFEPPEPAHICGKCWQAQPEDRKRYLSISGNTWRPLRSLNENLKDVR